MTKTKKNDFKLAQENGGFFEESFQPEFVQHKIIKYSKFHRISKGEGPEDVLAQKSTVERMEKELLVRESNAVFVGKYEDIDYNLEQYEESRDIWRMLKDVEDGKINTIIVSKINRLLRTVGDPKIIRKIRAILSDNYVKVIAADEQIQFKPDPNFEETIKEEHAVHAARQDKKTLIRSTQEGRRAQVKDEDNFRIAIPPIGFHVVVEKNPNNRKKKKYSYEIVEQEAELIRDIARIYVGLPPKIVAPVSPNYRGRMGENRIADHLNNNNFLKTSYIARLRRLGLEYYLTKLKIGEKWTSGNIAKILNNKMYNGQLVVTFQPVKAAKLPKLSKILSIPKIIDDELWAEVERIQTERSRSNPDIVSQNKAKCRGTKHSRFFLHGKIVCQNQGCQLRLKANASTDSYSCCKKRKKNDGQKHPSVNARGIEKAVQNVLLSNGDFKIFKKILIDGLKGITDIETSQNEMSRFLSLEKEILEEIKQKEKHYEELLIKVVPIGMEHVRVSAEKRLALEIDSKREKLESIQKQLQNLKKDKDKRIEIIEDVLSEMGSLEATVSACNDFLEDETLRSPVMLNASRVIDKIEIEQLPPIDVANTPLPELKEFYKTGRVRQKDFLKAGFKRSQIEGIFGSAKFSQNLNFKIRIFLLNGKVLEVTPNPEDFKTK